MVLLLTWVNVGILVTGLVLGLRQQETATRSVRSVVEMPAVLPAGREHLPARGPEEPIETAVTPSPGAGERILLTDDQLERLVRAVHTDDRVRTRTVALLQALDRYEKRKEIRQLDQGTRALLVDLARNAARARADLEWRLIRGNVLDLHEWDRQLEILDEELRGGVVDRLVGSLDPAELKRVQRLVVPPRFTVAAVR